MPIWPTSRPAASETIDLARERRRVDAAQRRSLRRAVPTAAALAALLLALDLGMNLLLETPGVGALAPFTLTAMAISAAVSFLSSRRRFRVEPLGIVAVMAIFGVSLLGLALTPEGQMLSTAQLAIILVGLGLFLPWSSPWHLTALVGSITLSLAFVISPLGAALEGSDRGSLVAAVLMAGVVSLIGHRLSQGRARAMLEQQFTLRRLSGYARRQETNVTELNRELNLVARRDSLTGVGNRLALDEAIASLLARGDRHSSASFALILFDVDHFKNYNDQHGHQAGDAALASIGGILLRATRGTDVAFRYGGEEFLLLVPDVDLAGAIAVAERVRVAAEEAIGIPPFTLSGGVALSDPADGSDPDPLVRRADAALYVAKRAGRNRIAGDEASVAIQRRAIAVA